MSAPSTVASPNGTATLATRTGLPGELRKDRYTLPADLSFDEWRDVLSLAEYIAEASPWWLVDTVRYGEVRFPDQHSQALPTAEEDPTGARQSRLKQAAWMGEKFPPDTRVTSLSYTHHRAVAELEPDDRQALLREAADERLGTRALIDRVKARQDTIRAEAMVGTSEPSCAADAPWSPTIDDLADDARAALEFHAAVLRISVERFAPGWIGALRWSEQQDCFREWRD